jgi:hypothetical protein
MLSFLLEVDWARTELEISKRKFPKIEEHLWKLFCKAVVNIRDEAGKHRDK